MLTIGQLEKANQAPLRVSRQDTVTKAITLMMQNDTAYLAVMSGDRTVDGILSWRTIESCHGHRFGYHSKLYASTNPMPMAPSTPRTIAV